jgi:hypothetical protein
VSKLSHLAPDEDYLTTELVDQRITYRGYVITYDPPPIPDRRWDWQFQHEQFCGDGDERNGQAASLTDAMYAIDEIEGPR